MGKKLLLFFFFGRCIMFWNFFSYHEAPLMFYQNFFIYHIDAMGHEVCILFYMVVVVPKKGYQCPKNVWMYHGLKLI
jgi:hypothetical protein